MIKRMEIPWKKPHIHTQRQQNGMQMHLNIVYHVYFARSSVTLFWVEILCSADAKKMHAYIPVWIRSVKISTAYYFFSKKSHCCSFTYIWKYVLSVINSRKAIVFVWHNRHCPLFFKCTFSNVRFMLTLGRLCNNISSKPDMFRFRWFNRAHITFVYASTAHKPIDTSTFISFFFSLAIHSHLSSFILCHWVSSNWNIPHV